MKVSESIRAITDMGAQNSGAGSASLFELIAQRRTQDCLYQIAEGMDVNVVDESGRSPFRCALDQGIAEVFKALYDLKAPLRPELPDGDTYLHFAVAHGHYDLAKLLLRDHSSFPKMKNAKNALGRTALHLAVQTSNAEMLALLLKYNSDSQIRDHDGLTPKDLAVTSSSSVAPELIEQLCVEDVMDKSQFQSKTKTSPHAPPELAPNVLPKRNSPQYNEPRSGGSTHGSKSTQEIAEEIPQEIASTPLETVESALDDEIRDNCIPVIKGSELIFEELINKGSSCEVFKAQWRGGDVAVKKFKDEYKENAKEMSKFVKEMQTLARVRHPNLILLMGICVDLPNLCLVTEYVPNMSLFYALHSRLYVENKVYRLSLTDRFQIALQVCKGLSYLHACDPPIVHRDLKPENCLLDHAMNVKIADFGLARPLTCFNTEEALTTTCIGTTRFMAPELFEKDKVGNIGVEVDIWALGCLLIELFSNKRPWDYISTTNVNCIYYEVSVIQIFKRKPVPVPDVIPEEIRDVIQRCCHYTPKKRPAVAEVLEVLELCRQRYV